MRLPEGPALPQKAAVRSLRGLFPTYQDLLLLLQMLLKGSVHLQKCLEAVGYWPGSTFPQSPLPGGEARSVSETIFVPQAASAGAAHPAKATTGPDGTRRKGTRELSGHPTRNLKSNMEIMTLAY